MKFIIKNATSDKDKNISKETSFYNSSDFVFVSEKSAKEIVSEIRSSRKFKNKEIIINE